MKRLPWKAVVALMAGLTMTIASGRASDSQAVIEVHARRFEFTPAEITLKKGVPVKLKLFSDDVAHSLVIEELQFDQLVNANDVAETTITPNQAGDFKGSCGKLCGVGHGKMQLIVHVVNNE